MRIDAGKVKRRGYWRTLLWWPFLLLLVLAFGVDLLVKIGLHRWTFAAEHLISAAVRGVLTWLFFAAVWRFMIRREQKRQ
ncbi:hypothetical protein AB0J55_33240 [Amycolatopsis sp. NPDC049688]|uniref:hypothetical protein n=1 Tax=Amycolatopsis sp. NPDC049688 TaxID=3154733 RepID=UPI003425A4AF